LSGDDARPSLSAVVLLLLLLFIIKKWTRLSVGSLHIRRLVPTDADELIARKILKLLIKLKFYVPPPYKTGRLDTYFPQRLACAFYRAVSEQAKRLARKSGSSK